MRHPNTMNKTEFIISPLNKPLRASPHSKQRRHACVMPLQEHHVLFFDFNGSLVPKRFILQPLKSF